ncbi:MAG: hypothetical protein J6386_17175 [Candidatus Synoicihabitans palmerolidicus]|nr:hypothetical protein [Candidatus Synoicihabitans palmerolidicus]
MVQAEEWTEALAAFGAAREIQSRLNGEFSRTKYADLSLLDQIEREIESLDAAGTALDVDESAATGEAVLASGDFTAASEAFEVARQLQLQMNREFPRSQFLSSQRAEELEVKRQTAESAPLWQSLQGESEAIDFLLR